MSILIKSDLVLINKLIDKYTQLYIKRDFMKIDIIDEINIDEIKIGLGIANVLAYSKIDDYKKLALKFSTIISSIVDDVNILIRCNNILSELTVFTFSNVLKKKKQYDTKLVNSNGFSLLKDLYRREFFSRCIGGKKVNLNSFQLEVSEAVSKSQNISVSAPTSIGKSFLMKKVILDTVLEDKTSKVIYLVPTRALIHEIMNDIQKEVSLLELNEKVFITCSSEITDEMLGNKCIFILTQERLNQFCSNVKRGFNVSLIVIDEAQQIAEGARGILLEYTIRRVKELWNNIKIFFISPLIHNPDIFAKRFSLEKCYLKNQQLSTVNQNVILLQKKYRKSLLEVKYKENTIGNINFVASRLSKIAQKIAYIYNKFNNNENSIIYCNNQSSTRNIANQLIKYDEFVNLNKEALNEFSDFLKNYICDKYDLVRLIKCGVAYHYSKLPTIVKIGIEDLAKNGELKVITCTSTLLEGINVQANNIYIYNPRKKNDLLTNLEFWNLSGRAGRMNNDICGNIVCIDLDNKWYCNKYSKKDIEDVELKKNKILSENLDEFNIYLKDRKSIEPNDKNKEKLKSYETLESILILEKLDGKDLVKEYDYEDNNIDIADSIVTEKISKNLVPQELLKKLVGINIESINKLWKTFINNYEIIESYFLLNPFSEGADEKFYNILKGINKIFLDGKYSNKCLNAIQMTAFDWVREKSMKEILFYKYDLDNNSSESINKRIEYRLNFLNQTIRFEISKYLYAYQEILKEVLRVKGNEDYIEKLCNYPLYLEFGASNKATLELMYLGIFREGAITLSKFIHNEDTDEIYEKLKLLDIESLQINKYIKNKIIEKIKFL